MENAIGGYFELELPPPQSIFHPQALCFQSARAAFLALLRTGCPQRVWMPRYICDSMLDPLARAGVEIAFYAIDKQLKIDGDIDLKPEDWLFYVNYFGICSANIDQILTQYNPNQVILDCSQAFYASPRKCLANIYSPRKFFGVADGGLLVTPLPVPLPSAIDQGSLNRTVHLIQRLADSPESGFQDYQRAEQSLSECEPYQISQLTRRMLMGIDYARARNQRNQNFNFLNELLADHNHLSLDLSNINGPLCYPLFVERPDIRKRLIASRVFVPTYWPDVLTRSEPGATENFLAMHCLPLPIDQRYKAEDLQKIVDLILDELNF